MDFRRQNFHSQGSSHALYPVMSLKFCGRKFSVYNSDSILTGQDSQSTRFDWPFGSLSESRLLFIESVPTIKPLIAIAHSLHGTHMTFRAITIAMVWMILRGNMNYIAVMCSKLQDCFITLWWHSDDCEVTGYAHVQSMTTCVSILYDAHQGIWKRSNIAICSTLEPSVLVEKGDCQIEARMDW